MQKPDMLKGREVGGGGCGGVLIHLLPAERLGVCNEFFGQVLKSSGCNGILLQRTRILFAQAKHVPDIFINVARGQRGQPERMLSQGCQGSSRSTH